MSGRRPPGVGATLGTLFRSALDQLGTMREAVDRGTQLQRNWFDATLLHRKRKDAMALLGEAVYRAAVAGQLERVGEDPQFRRLVDDIDELDQRIEVAEQRAQTQGGPSTARASGRPTRPSRPRSNAGAGGSEPRVWRPVAAWNAPDAASGPDSTGPERHHANARRRRPGRTGEVPDLGDMNAPGRAADPMSAPMSAPMTDPAAYPDDYDALDGDNPPAWTGVVRAAPRRPFEPSPDALGDEFGYRIEDDDAVSAFPARAARHFGRAHDGLDDDLDQYMHEDDVPELAGSSTAAGSAASASDEPPKRRRSRAAAAKRARQSNREDS